MITVLPMSGPGHLERTKDHARALALNHPAIGDTSLVYRASGQAATVRLVGTTRGDFYEETEIPFSGAGIDRSDSL